MSAAHADNIKKTQQRKHCHHHLWHLESHSGKFRYRNQTNILILSWSNFFQKWISKFNSDPKNRKYPAGYPILVMSMLTSDIQPANRIVIISGPDQLRFSTKWRQCIKCEFRFRTRMSSLLVNLGLGIALVWGSFAWHVNTQ